jgi:hypothetical protein
MNIAMEQTEEYVDGQLKAKYGDCFIRGNNGTFVGLMLYGMLMTLIAESHTRTICVLRFDPCPVLYISGQKRK